MDSYKKLINIQKRLMLDFGNFSDEFPEQLMAVTYLTGKEKVLEIGGNIGRNSMIIGYILNQFQNNNFVTLECDTYISKQLTHNRNINNLKFYVENSALSKRNLIQKGWSTIVSDTVLPEYTKVNTITFEELVKKYNIEFDTLVLDCEGAFYYILLDMPEILKNIKLIIVENDYQGVGHRQYVADVLKSNGFRVDYSLCHPWADDESFFEVWSR